MRIAKATLISRHTKDGISFVFETVPLGKEYLVDLDSVETDGGWWNVKAQRMYVRESVMVVDSEGNPLGPMPTELLVVSS